MKNWKRLPALLLSGALALSLFACTAANPTATAQAKGDTYDADGNLVPPPSLPARTRPPPPAPPPKSWPT
jgi:hypothetical protein